MTYVRKKGRRFWLPAGLSILAAALAATMWVTVAAGRSSKSTASTIKIAILSDCQGAFASNYEQDIGGAISALAQYAGVKPKNPNKPSAGWTGGQINGHPLKLVGIGLAASTNRFALGCVARKVPSASGLPAPLAAAARRNSRNSSPVRTGKPFVEWATMSVWTWSAR